MRQTSKIEKEYLILCEGIDEYYFFVALLNSNEFSDDLRFANEIQVMNFGGNSELTNFLGILSAMDGFSKLKAIMIVRDAERDWSKAVSEIQKALCANSLEVPARAGEWQTGMPKTAFLLFPSLDQSCRNGTLEDLCLDILEEKERKDVLEKIDAFLSQMRLSFGFSHNKAFKNKLHTYLSITDKFVGLKLGEAASAKAFNWQDGSLTFFKTFFQEVFDE